MPVIDFTRQPWYLAKQAGSTPLDLLCLGAKRNQMFDPARDPSPVRFIGLSVQPQCAANIGQPASDERIVDQRALAGEQAQLFFPRRDIAGNQSLRERL